MEKNTNNRGGSSVGAVIEFVVVVFSILALFNRTVLYSWADQYTGLFGLGADAVVLTIFVIGAVHLILLAVFVVAIIIYIALLVGNKTAEAIL